MDTADRTNFNAGAATRTLGVVDAGKVIVHVDRIVRAGLFTLAAGDAAVCTDLPCLPAILAVGAGNMHLGGQRNNLD